MPNWVSNQINITGPKEELDRLQKQAATPYQTKSSVLTEDGFEWVDAENQEELSFWNFVSPDESILEEYFGPEANKTLEQALRHETNHWYDWNVRNWGVKWDASYVGVTQVSDTEIAYTFETPWDAVVPVFLKMVEEYPALDFEYRYLEEQGWGGSFTPQKVSTG